MLGRAHRHLRYPAGNGRLPEMTVERVPHGQSRRDVARGVAARVGQIAVMFFVIGVVLFGAAGRLDWIWGWAYLGIYLASTLVNGWFLRRNAELVAERGRPGEMPAWDKALGGLWSLAQFVLLPLVAGLDVRFGWTGPVHVAWHVAGTVVFASGLAMFGWAMIANAYFSTVARVQPERGQTVCQDGIENSYATDWLRDHLADGGADLKQLIKEAGEVGISRRTLFYCRKKAGVVTRSSGFGKFKKSTWELLHE